MKLIYPTKEVSYLSIVESKTHDIDLSLFIAQEHRAASSPSPVAATAVPQRPSQATAIENRRNNSNLERISESSVLQENVNTNGKHEEDNIATTSKKSQSNNKLVRKGSFDSSTENTSSTRNAHQNISKSSSLNNDEYSDETLNSSIESSSTFDDNQVKQRVTFTNQNTMTEPTILDVQLSASTERTIERIVNKSGGTKMIFPNFSSMQTNPLDTAKIDPNEAYFNLFQHCNIETSIPVPVENELSINGLDLYHCFMHVFRIGVIYIAANDANDEKKILSHSSGSIRYKQFLNGLGTFIKIKDLDSSKIYPGSLSTEGSSGDFSIHWTDGITQIIFNVVTLMPTKENETNQKKKHVGNDDTIIVYNESREGYQFNNTMLSQVNAMCVEIEPLKSGANNIRFKTGNDMANTADKWFVNKESQVVSDKYLPAFVRKMAFHANLAVKLHRQQKLFSDNYGGQWWQRMKKIQAIKTRINDNKAKMSANNLPNF